MHLAAERGHTGTVEFLADKFKASVFDRTKVSDGGSFENLNRIGWSLQSNLFYQYKHWLQ